ncbi:uroporphyrinogen-III C-methyltransferase [Maribellus sp. CM-23]|uniref:uroporphyrinogen-III C-methyltransferase n=1 Tax=Maribellus sp. CM-23 TaxID=2781026 RepID=UPI001F3B9FA8|nr:uroporphyrinogen-III C-methyltransferase [Maribellus sp. CM-23]MCE4565630.1 uroporphyrinogen-III C-methyltransferase [Maribellus sp. CM-23]
MQKGKVYIVGAGPGPADLLTIRAHRAIGEADVVLYDALVSREVRQLFPEKAELVFVGKRAGDGRDVTVRQNAIHAKMLQHSQEGKTVVRVKSGDPMVFSRGAEETSFLKENEIPYEVIPGISAFNAAAAEFGVALTDRRGSNSLHLLSGTDVSGKPLNAQHLADILEKRGTAVLYMGTKVLDQIVTAFDPAERGQISATIVSRTGLPDSAIMEGKLTEVAEQHSIAPLKTPALIFLKKY